MKPRIDFEKLAPPEAVRPLFLLGQYIDKCGLETSLMDLMKLRASQVNGCAYCIDMHTKDARARGETEQRLYELDAWRETPFYTDRERAALAWTEAVTLVAKDHVPDDVYEETRNQFTEIELLNLTLVVIAINAWNRVCIASRVVPGAYQPVGLAASNKPSGA